MMSLLFNTLSRLVIAFLPRSKCPLILRPQSPSTVILEAKKIKSVTVSTFFPSVCHEVSDRTRCHDLRFFECWVLSQIFHPPLSPLSRGSLVPFYFLPLKWYHLHIWGCWYFSWQCWFHYDRKAFKFCHFSGSSFILESFLCHMKLSGNHVDTSLLWICLCPSLFFFKFRIQSEILQCICHVSLFFYHLEMLLSFFFF